MKESYSQNLCKLFVFQRINFITFEPAEKL